MIITALVAARGLAMARSDVGQEEARLRTYASAYERARRRLGPARPSRGGAQAVLKHDGLLDEARTVMDGA